MENLSVYFVGGWNDGATGTLADVCPGMQIDFPFRASYTIRREVLFGHVVHLALPMVRTEDGPIRQLFPEKLAALILAGEMAGPPHDAEQLYAGEEPYVHEGTCATPAQWIWLWNRATPQKRLSVAQSIQRDAATAQACFFGGHVHRLTELQNAWFEGPGRPEAAVSMVLALAYELDEESPTDSSAPQIAARLRAVVEQAMNGPAPVLVPTTTTAPPALLATTRFPVPEGCCPHCGAPQKEEERTT